MDVFFCLKVFICIRFFIICRIVFLGFFVDLYLRMFKSFKFFFIEFWIIFIGLIVLVIWIVEFLLILVFNEFYMFLILWLYCLVCKFIGMLIFGKLCLLNVLFYLKLCVFDLDKMVLSLVRYSRMIGIFGFVMCFV